MNNNQTSKKRKVLIVDDEKDICTLLTLSLTRMGVLADTAGSVSEANEILATNKYDFCLTDMRLPDGEGLQIVQNIAANYHELPVAVLTAHANMNNAIAALKAGAFDYLTKPISNQQLEDLLNVAFSLNDIQNKLPKAEIVNQISGSTRNNILDTLIGESESISQLKNLIEKLGRSNVPVFINGESGSGKELVARAIHKLSGRAIKPFIAVNCGAIPESLCESEFFGYRKGSFTGAESDRNGLFQAANGGSLFLDEIADLPPSMQVKLLRAIQEKTIRRVGDTTEIPVDVRIISATHRNLQELINNGDFRQDLYFRLNVLEVYVPPLRERVEDIHSIALHIVKRISPKITITDEAFSKLTKYDYPGNVRELENILERAVAISDGKTVNDKDLWFNPSNNQTDSSIDITGEITNSIRNTAISNNKPLKLDELLDKVKSNIIEKAYTNLNYNLEDTANQLGMPKNQLEDYLKKYNLVN